MTAARFDPRRARSTPGAAGVWRGIVTRISDGNPYVEVPRVAPGVEYGPLPTVVTGLAAGDLVIVAPLEGRPDDLVILGKLAPPVP